MKFQLLIQSLVVCKKGLTPVTIFNIHRRPDKTVKTLAEEIYIWVSFLYQLLANDPSQVAIGTIH